MTVIRATCSECQLDCELAAPDFLVVVRDCGDGHYYVFSCPHCHEMSRRHAEPLVVNLLAQNGVRVHQLHVPEEVVEIERLDAPAITTDDVLDFICEMRKWWQ